MSLRSSPTRESCEKRRLHRTKAKFGMKNWALSSPEIEIKPSDDVP